MEELPVGEDPTWAVHHEVGALVPGPSMVEAVWGPEDPSQVVGQAQHRAVEALEAGQTAAEADDKRGALLVGVALPYQDAAADLDRTLHWWAAA